MAIYHLHQGSINRGKGHSAFDALAYQARERIINEYTGEVVNYTHKGESTYSLFALPDHADKEVFSTPLDLAREMERAEESANGCIGLNGDVALPKELTMEQQEELIKMFAKTFTEQGQAVIINRHEAHSDIDGKSNSNDHIHYIATIRPFTEDGKALSTKNKCFNEYEVTNGTERKFMSADVLKDNPDFEKIYKYRLGKKVEQLTQTQASEMGLNPTKDRTSRAPLQRTVYYNEYLSRDNLIERRKAWEVCSNEVLKKYEINQTISSESYEAQGIDKLPTKHLGSKLHRLQQKGIELAVTLYNKTVQEINQQIVEARSQINELLKDIRQELKQNADVNPRETEIQSELETRRTKIYNLTSQSKANDKLWTKASNDVNAIEIKINKFNRLNKAEKLMAFVMSSTNLETLENELETAKQTRNKYFEKATTYENKLKPLQDEVVILENELRAIRRSETAIEQPKTVERTSAFNNMRSRSTSETRAEREDIKMDSSKDIQSKLYNQSVDIYRITLSVDKEQHGNWETFNDLKRERSGMIENYKELLSQVPEEQRKEIIEKSAIPEDERKAIIAELNLSNSKLADIKATGYLNEQSRNILKELSPTPEIQDRKRGLEHEI